MPGLTVLGMPLTAVSDRSRQVNSDRDFRAVRQGNVDNDGEWMMDQAADGEEADEALLSSSTSSMRSRTTSMTFSVEIRKRTVWS